MKKIMIIFVAMFMTSATFAQYKNWALELEAGTHKVSDESAITVDNPLHFGLGLRYNFNPKVGLGLTGAYDKGVLENFEYIDVDLKYTRFNLEAYLNIFKILDLHSNYFTILAHGGPGFSNINSEEHKENLLNVHWGVTGLLKLSNRVALKADVSTTNHFSQSKTIDGYSDMTNQGVNSVLNNTSVGLVFYLGKKKAKKHADWYKSEAIIPTIAKRDTLVIIQKPVVNNYVTSECNCEYLTEEHVFFEHDKYEISKEYDKVDISNNPMFKTFLTLQRNPKLTVIVKAWASATESSNEYNLILSEKRAKELKKKLVYMGIDESRIKIDANGKDFDFSAKGVHGMARRVDLIIVKANK